ncbi:MAG: hypothetical protein JXA71_17870 [Chitinispirillaceae bacterium]|nr:hypothetical protein [Chitinispirillaceae bacterium]
MVKETHSWRASGLMVVTALTGMLLYSGCSLFSPRESEWPVDPGRVDPLNFASIMDGTPERFTRLRYEDLFEERVLYEDINSGVYGKSQLILRLQQIQRQYPLVQVAWEGGRWWKRNDTIFLSDLAYTVMPEGMQGTAPAETGTSNFIVAKEWEWRIVEWRDIPAKPGKSFFSP